MRQCLIDSCSITQQIIIGQTVDKWRFKLRYQLDTETDSLNSWYVLLLHCIVGPCFHSYVMFRLNVQDENDDI